MENESFINKENTRKPKKICVCNKCCKIFLIVMAFIFLFILIFGIVVAILAAGPLHAQCQIQWDVGANCSAVEESLISQMKLWHTADNCKDGGQRCLYEYKKSSGNQLFGTHETPIKHYIDDLTFTFTDNGERCQVGGYSRSQVWYAIYDYGTNYCNLHNLVEGAGLNGTQGYEEDTNEGICTQYVMADCDKY